MSVDIELNKLAAAGLSRLTEILQKRKHNCDHEGMEFRPVAFEDSYHIEFSCPKCGWGGAMHPDQLADYEKLAREYEEHGINDSAQNGNLKIIKQ